MIRLEKFFIEADSFSSKTLANFQMNDRSEQLVNYRFAHRQDKVAILTTQGLYVFSLLGISSDSDEPISLHDSDRDDLHG